MSRLPDAVGTVLYDDSCGFCRQWVPFWASTLRKRALEIAPLQSAWSLYAADLSEAEWYDDLRLVLASGEHIRGADVYRYAMRRIWWAYPFYLLSIAPGFRRLFDYGYRSFARNRFRFSRACGLPNHSAA